MEWHLNCIKYSPWLLYSWLL